MLKSNLRVLMAKKEITIIELAEKVETNKDTLTKIKNNKAKQISIKILDNLCDYFDCQLDDLFTIIPEEE